MLITHILRTYAQISQPDLDVNLMYFNTDIDPILPLAVYTRKQDKCQVFAHNAGVPISDATMVTTRTKHALATENMTLAWHKWKHCPIANHTWPNWKAHWTAAFTDMHDINHMMAGEFTFGANAAEEEEQGRLIALSLKNLANASIQKNLTIDSLVAINAQLTQALADMQIAMACMSPPVHAPPYSGTIPVWGPNPLPTAALPAVIGHGLMLSLSIAKWRDSLSCQSPVYDGDRQAPPNLSNLLLEGTDLDPDTWLTRHGLMRHSYVERPMHQIFSPICFLKESIHIYKIPQILDMNEFPPNVHIVRRLRYLGDISQALEKPGRNFTQVGEAPTWKILLHHVEFYAMYTPFLNSRSFILRLK